MQRGEVEVEVPSRATDVLDVGSFFGFRRKENSYPDEYLIHSPRRVEKGQNFCTRDAHPLPAMG